MKIGMMNNPEHSLSEEIDYAKNHNFDFLDLTLEPPGAFPSQLSVREIRSRLNDSGLMAVGHTAWFLPSDFPFPKIQKSVQKEFEYQFNIFQQIDICKVTIHLRFSYPHRFSAYEEKLYRWESILDPLVSSSNKHEITLMLENGFNQKDHDRLLSDLLNEFPAIGFHLDVGHANLNVQQNSTAKYLHHFGERLLHIHLSDNFGGSEDLHLPLGAGNIDWKNILNNLKTSGYNDTITLEVFSPEREYLLLSRKLLRKWWRD